MSLGDLTRGAVAAAVLVALIAAASASAGPDLDEVRVAKHRDGPYEGHEIDARVKKPKSFYMRIANTESGKHDVKLYDVSSGADADYKVKWYLGGKDVSHDVQTAGYAFKVRRGDPKVFRAKVRPRAEEPGDFCLAGRFENPEASLPEFGLVSIGQPGFCSG